MPKAGARKSGAARKGAAKTADRPAAAPKATKGAEPRSAATRASNAAPGTEIGGPSGPQEAGPTRGARRPYTEVLAGARRVSAVVIVPTEAEEKFKEREKRALAERQKLDEAPLESHEVIATRTGFYAPPGGSPKRYRAGHVFTMQIPKGGKLETHASWVEPLKEYEADQKAGGPPAPGSAAARRGAKKTVVAEKSGATAAEDRKEAAEALKADKDKDVL